MSRILVTSVFSAATFAVAVSALHALDAAFDANTLQLWSEAAYQVLRLGVFLAFTAAVARRNDSIRRSRRPLALAACLGALVGIAALRGPDGSSTSSILAGDLVAAVSEAWLLVAVLSLGRCFGILPEARGLVTRGAYRVVRHPVYLGELGAVAGLVIAAASWWNLVMVGIVVAAQLLRMQLEERELSEHFPAYRAYAARTPMLIPVPRKRARGLVPAEPLNLAAISASTSSPQS